MAKATTTYKSAFPDVTLELNPEEARALVEYLSVHSTSSSINTYPIFAALTHALGDYPSPLQSMEIVDRVTQTDSGLVEIREG